MNMTTRILMTLLGCSITVGCNTDTTDEETLEGMPTEVPATDEPVAEATQALLGSDACKNTEITVTNLRERSGVETDLLVTKVEYYSASEARWYTEDLSNEEVDFGTSLTWNNEDLQHAENDLLTKFRVYYQYETGHAWSSLVYQEVDIVDDVCHADDNYSLTVR